MQSSSNQLDYRSLTSQAGLDLLRRDWIAVARASEVGSPGDFIAFDLLGEPVVLVRDRQGRLRAHANVCRHRFSTLVEGSGNTVRLVCPYHRWTYSLTGELVGAPCMEDNLPDKAAYGLHSYAVEEWQGWVFVALEGHPEPLAPRLAPLTAVLGELAIEDWVVARTIDYPSPWNWALMVENFSESYHHLAVHTETLEPRWPAAKTRGQATNGHYSELHHPIDSEHGTFKVFTVFPCFAIAVQDPLPVLFWPRLIAKDETYFDLRMHVIVQPEMAADSGVIDQLAAAIDRIHREDIPLMQRAYRGLASRHARLGPLSPLEQPLTVFHDYIGKHQR